MENIALSPGNDVASRKRPFSELVANTLSPPSAGRVRKQRSSTSDRCQDVAEPATVSGEEGVSQHDEAVTTSGNGTGSHCQELRHQTVLEVPEEQSGAARPETLSPRLEDDLFGAAAAEEQCSAKQTPKQDADQQRKLLQPAVEVDPDTLYPEVEDGHAAQQQGANMNFSATQYPDLDDEDLADQQETAHMKFSATQFPELVDEELMAEPAEVGISAEQQPEIEDSEHFQQPATPSGRRLPDADASKQNSASGKHESEIDREAIYEDSPPANKSTTLPPEAPESEPEGGPASCQPQQFARASKASQHRHTTALHSWLRTDTPAKAAMPASPLDRDCYQAEDEDNNLPGRGSKCPRRLAGDIEGAEMSVTDASGERVYCRVLDNLKGPASGLADLRRRKGRLLSQPIGLLLDQVEQAAFDSALRASDLASAAQARQQAGACGSNQEASAVAGEQLWVDKYSPKSFLELLSDEQINREVICWLKSWDRCVFGRQAAPRQGDRKGKAKAPSMPEHRILLLGGAPGLGKTTLAHVVARHCGYRPVEINASDDRTGAALHTRITDAAQMTSVVDPSKKPNCIIIDEIDGVAGGAEGKSAISTLLKLIQKAPAKAEAQDAQLTLRVKKKKAQQALVKPLIAICNDLYAPVLRPLRNVAQVVSFKQPQVDKLVMRLRLVAAKERLQVDRQALVVLCERTECDVRSCLNTLQFLGRRGSRIRVCDVKGLNVGQKDMTKGAFSIWTELLSTKASNRRKDGEDCSRLYSTLEDYGDHELMLNGVHENVLGLSYMDPHLLGTVGVFDHLHHADLLLTTARRRLDYGLMAYVPAPLLSVHATVAQYGRPQLQWPKGQADCHRGQSGNQALLQGWLLGCRSVFSFLSPRIAVQEVLPCLLRVLCRPLRPVAPNLFTAAERAVMAELVSLLLAHGLTFDLEPDGNREPPMLRPEVQRLCSFPSFAVPQRTLPAAVRQLVVHAAQMEGLRRKDQARDNKDATLAPLQVEAASTAIKAAAKASGSRPESAGTKLMFSVAERALEAGKGTGQRKLARKGSWLDKLRESRTSRKPLPAFAHQHQAKSNGSEAGEARTQLPVLYKYKEGFTNAVKRPVVMKDLL